MNRQTIPKSKARKYIRNAGILAFFSVLLFSCASGAPSKADASYESGEVSNRASRSPGSANDERMVAYSVLLELSVKKTDETRKTLIEQVPNNNGFIVKETDNYITARIPVENMERFLINARTLGKVENETKTGTDITDQYRDNVIRLESLKSVRERYLALLAKANTVSDILSIEKELERVNTEIEILEGKINHAESSVALSNITVRFREKAKPGPIGWIFYGLYRGMKWLFVWD
jgi:hypothetical protein